MTIPNKFTSPLATPEEVYGEKMVLRILASAEVCAAREKARELLTSHSIAKTADGRARVDYALDHWMAQLAVQMVGADLHTPRILWNATITRFRWFGLEFPGSAAGIDCPDNIYRTLALNGATEYEIVGRVHANRPAQFSFHLTPHPGADGFWTTDDLKDVAGFQMLTNDDLDIAGDGTFRITFGQEPVDGRRNYIYMPPGKKIVLIRDTLSNWQQIPNALSVRRTGGEVLPDKPMSEQELINQTAAGLQQNIAFWLRWVGNFHSTSLPNTLVPPYGRSGAFGYASAGKFNLQDDQALVITVADGNARYSGMQLTDLWGIAPSPTEYLASYNKTQAITNPDGTRTFVIARKDPGFANWVDTAGWREGWAFFRWQGVPDDLDSEQLIIEQKVVQVTDIEPALTKSFPRISTDTRREELKQRVADWELRIAVAD